LDLSAANKGIVVSVDRQEQIDAGAVRVNFESIAADVSRADVMRVVLQAITKLSAKKPTLLIVASGGQERLLLDGKDIGDVAFQYQNDKPIPAWRLFAERASRPDGSTIKLPEGLMARTTASFALVDELMGPNKAEGSRAAVSATDDKLAKADTWHGKAGEHGEVVTKILSSVHSTQLEVKGGYLNHQQLDKLFSSLLDSYGKAVTDAKVAMQQREQGTDVQVPPGSSELIGLQLRYSEVLNVSDDQMLVPFNRFMVSLAPESTFAGLTIYGKHGEVKTRATGKSKSWSAGYSGEHSSYITRLTTDRGFIAPMLNDVMFRWGDIKDKIAFDFSQQKMNEDSDLERRAMSAAN
jgi:hypothetical protein